ncbi:hypothetical protein ACA910_011504 [Epithemia clementina (nom. ined.)]
MDKYARFEAWLRENGARFDQLELCEYETGTGNNSPGRKAGTGNKHNKLKTPSSSSSLSSSFLDSAITGSAAAGGGEEKKETTTSSIDDDDEDKDDNNNRGAGEEESEMRGIHAKTHIPPNTVCMSIPRRCLITVEMGQATSIGQAIYHSDLDLDAPKHIYLMIYILWDRKVHGNNSFFAPYYDTLPKTLHNMPIFWTPEELAELQGSYLLHQIADRNQAIAEDYYTICAVAPQLRQICTLNEFKWARMCVCSRNFGLQIDGHRTSALVPHADMLNHYRPRETKWTFDEDHNAFTITTLQHIPAGAQVYDSYGQKCNHRFLLNYGFAVEDNRELDGFCPNEVPLELSVDPNDPNYAEKMEFWTRGEVGYHQQQPSCYPPNLNSNNNCTSSVPPALVDSSVITSSLMTPASPQAQNEPGRGRYTGIIGGNGRTGRIGIPGKSSAQSNAMQQQQPPHSGSSSSSSMSSSSSTSQNTTMKRVRVCVSNNENTRLLFSLLRALACNEAELRAIRAPMSSSSLTFHPTNDPFASSRTSAVFGFSPAASASHHVLSGTPTPMLSASSSSSSSASFFRSCRDIRHPISLRNERAALRLLLDLVGQHLARYPTTLAQDVADLSDEQAYPRFSNRRHAKIQVKGEKEVLHHFALWAKTALDVLQVMEQDLAALEQQWTDQQLHQQQQQAPQISPSSSNCSGVEVKLTRSGLTVTDESSLLTSSRGGVGGGSLWSSTITTTDNFDALIRRMEDASNMSSSPSAPPAPLSYGSSSNHHHHATLEEDEEEDSSANSGSGGSNHEVHHTILRYCADVLGSLMREEVKNLKHRLRWRVASNSSNGGNHNGNTNNSSSSNGRGGQKGGRATSPRN